MIRLYVFGERFGTPDGSPFCMKLELFLQLAGIAHEKAACDLQTAPKGKAPYAEIDGRLIGDSALVIDHLERSRGIDLDRGLGLVERAIAHAFAVMLEERTYFALVHARWQDDRNWQVLSEAYFPELPQPLREQRRLNSAETLRRQGIGRHAADEIAAMGKADIDALAVWLGDKPFTMGERPTKLDCTAGAFITAILADGLEHGLKNAARGHANLVAYRDRMRAFFGPPLQAPAVTAAA